MFPDGRFKTELQTVPQDAQNRNDKMIKKKLEKKTDGLLLEQKQTSESRFARI